MSEFNDIFAKASVNELRRRLRVDGLKLKSIKLGQCLDIMSKYYSEESYSVEGDRSDEALHFYSDIIHQKGYCSSIEYIYRPKTHEPDMTAFRLKLTAHFNIHETLYDKDGPGLAHKMPDQIVNSKLFWGHDAASLLESFLHSYKSFQILKDYEPRFCRISCDSFYGSHY